MGLSLLILQYITMYLLPLSHSQEEGRIAIIEQSELYAPNSDPNQDLLNPHKDCKFLSKLNDPAHLCRSEDGSEPILRSLASANVPRQVMDSVLHGRELGMQQLPGNIKTLLHRNQADAFKVKLRKSLADGTWGLPDIVDPESVVMSPPLLPARSPPCQPELSPAPTVQSTLSSYNSASSVPSYSQALSESGQQVPPVDPSHFGGSDQHTISYYSSSSAAPSPASTHTSLPTSDHTHSRPRSPYSAVSSPASSGMGVVSSLSPSSSFMSSATSVQRGVKRKTMSSIDSVDSMGFSTRAPGAAIASIFGNSSTNFLPNFSEVPFQSTQVPVPNQSLPDQYNNSFQAMPPASVANNDSELGQILDHFDSIPSTHIQNQNGDEILQQCLTEPPRVGSGEIRFYDSDHASNDCVNGHMISASHHMMSGDVTVSASAAGQFLGTGEQQNGTDIMEILSQFS